MNNTYQDHGHWNAILNALPKAQRGPYKLSNIAQPERQKVGTPSYRVLNVYDPAQPQGSPWVTGNISGN